VNVFVLGFLDTLWERKEGNRRQKHRKLIIVEFLRAAVSSAERKQLRSCCKSLTAF